MPPSFEPSEYKDVETINYWEKASKKKPPLLIRTSKTV
jgi:hypothetical protein